MVSRCKLREFYNTTTLEMNDCIVKCSLSRSVVSFLSGLHLALLRTWLYTSSELNFLQQLALV